MLKLPVGITVSLYSFRRGAGEYAVVRGWGLPERGAATSLWLRRLPLPTTPEDEPVMRLRAAAIAILEATGGLPDA